MAASLASYLAEEDLEPSRFVAIGAADHEMKKAVLTDDIIGVSHEGTREAPIPGVTPLAAKAGESVRGYGESETCEVETGAIAILRGQFVAADANSRAQPAIHGFRYGGQAEAAGAANQKVRIVVRFGTHDNSNKTVVKTTDYTVALSDLGATLSNEGAGAAVTFSLPAAFVGAEVRARVGAAQELRLDPNGTETIALPGTGVQGAAGKYLTANAANETVVLKCNQAGTWDVISHQGTWTAEA